jgi:TPR repeat protein
MNAFSLRPAVMLAAALMLLAGIGVGGVLPMAQAATVTQGDHYGPKSKKLKTALEDYESGNYPVALKEFKAQAERGDRIAEFNYAMMLLNGEGTDHDLPNALIWLKKAADANMAHAQFTYGRVYDDGQIVAPDPKRAHYWFLKAARQGHLEAQVALATQYMDGRGTPRNYHEAFNWYLKAAKAGDQASQYIVGSFYEKGGDGVTVNLTSARLWYALAAAQGGDPAAAGKYAEVSERLRQTHSDNPDAAPRQPKQPTPEHPAQAAPTI